MLLIAVAGELEASAPLLVIGFFLGVGGTTFAVGIPFVNAWYDPSLPWFRQAFLCRDGRYRTVGILHPRFVNWFGYFATHVIIAVVPWWLP